MRSGIGRGDFKLARPSKGQYFFSVKLSTNPHTETRQKGNFSSLVVDIFCPLKRKVGEKLPALLWYFFIQGKFLPEKEWATFKWATFKKLMHFFFFLFLDF